MTVTSVAVAVKKFLFDMCDWTVDSDVCTCDFSHLPVILHAHVRSPVSSGMDCVYCNVLFKSLLFG